MESNKRPLAVRGSLLAFLTHFLSVQRPPSSLIICSTEEGFLEGLTGPSASASLGVLQALLCPTLEHIHTHEQVHVAFCPSVQSLKAYLSVFEACSKPNPEHESGQRRPILAVINLISVHEGTSSDSAQGLSRACAMAVEAAIRTGLELMFFETAEIPRRYDGWERQVGILSSTTRSFRSGERAWVGRTVPVKAMLGRWCRFVELEESLF
ncbi:hypothetical protein P152DRAFT_426140 [Eremomyces bilateralis CBS 781.70]|uniref:Uncharacterized protein n=1 Tax=Eremomyces bilateralis CBS 781.70 TaxID=1392243 RepID=A0A6G1GFQ1_9PEZI|nr:uncharacterized protein P152DRAFT_426140 [Eremomyces bilateralis CBS 781.70]KAF1816822.1 hypothetical protein P152DRAFT_426140 [Eremomyces bilateralis CBS 781.70]